MIQFKHILILLLLIIDSSCSDDVKFIEYDGNIWNTEFHIKYESNRNLDDSINIVLHKIEMSLSPFQQESVVSKINDNRTDTVDSIFLKVFNASKQIYNYSNGVFDPTIAPLVNLWGFGTSAKSQIEPTPEQVAFALNTVGIDSCRIQDGKIYKKRNNTEFNFSAIAKGFGIDEVGSLFSRNGIKNYMIEIGGEILVSGKNQQGSTWKIQIDTPVSNEYITTHSQFTVIEISNCGIATSGNYRNWRKLSNGEIIGHTISTSTGCPLKNELLSATVIAPTCMIADGLATACMGMSANEAIQMIEGVKGASCLLIYSLDDANLIVSTSSTFPTITNH